MEIQHKITACGLNEHDQAILKSFLKVLNLGEASPWVYSDEENAEVVIVDPDQEEGKEFIWAYQIGVHDKKLMVSVGDDVSGGQSARSLARPLRCNNLREMFDGLLDVNGSLVDDV